MTAPLCHGTAAKTMAREADARAASLEARARETRDPIAADLLFRAATAERLYARRLLRTS